MSKTCYCRPKWWDEALMNRPDTRNYKAIQVPKDSEEVEDIFASKYLDELPEDYVWKIVVSNGYVHRSNKDFQDEFIILDIPVEV